MIRGFLLNISLATLLGCTSFGGPVEEIIERSKARQPNWTEIAEDKSKIDDKKITYVSVRSHLQDLPLAVKETQIVTLTESEAFLRGRLTQRISRVAEDAKITVLNTPTFHKVITDNVKESHSKNASVTDIYYEKIRGGEKGEDFNEYYKVYVRVDYFKRHLPGLLASINNDFKNSKHPDLKQLGAKMTNSIEQLLGH